MNYLIVIGGVAVMAYAWYRVWKKHSDDEKARDAVFEATMRSLEEKAKREGTFVISYFDNQTNKDS